MEISSWEISGVHSFGVPLLTGSQGYVCPEVARLEADAMQHRQQGRDIYGAGIVLGEIITGCNPAADVDIHLTVGLIIAGAEFLKLLKSAPNITSAFYDQIGIMLAPDPEDRHHAAKFVTTLSSLQQTPSPHCFLPPLAAPAHVTCFPDPTTSNHTGSPLFPSPSSSSLFQTLPETSPMSSAIPASDSGQAAQDNFRPTFPPDSLVYPPITVTSIAAQEYVTNRKRSASEMLSTPSSPSTVPMKTTESYRQLGLLIETRQYDRLILSRHTNSTKRGIYGLVD